MVVNKLLTLWHTTIYWHCELMLLCLFSFSMLWVNSFKGRRSTNLQAKVTILSRNMLAKGWGNYQRGEVGSSLNLDLFSPVHVCTWVFLMFEGICLHHMAFFPLLIQQKVLGLYTSTGTFFYNLREITRAYLHFPPKNSKRTVLESVGNCAQTCWSWAHTLWLILKTYMEWIFLKYSFKNLSHKENI